MLILLDGMSRGFNYVKGLDRHYSRSTPFSFELIWTWHRMLYRALRNKEIQDSGTNERRACTSTILGAGFSTTDLHHRIWACSSA